MNLNPRVSSNLLAALIRPGLGLSIVKNAILLHGGTITATSPAGPAGSGLRFDFTLHR